MYGNKCMHRTQGYGHIGPTCGIMQLNMNVSLEISISSLVHNQYNVSNLAMPTSAFHPNSRFGLFCRSISFRSANSFEYVWWCDRGRSDVIISIHTTIFQLLALRVDCRIYSVRTFQRSEINARYAENASLL